MTRPDPTDPLDPDRVDPAGPVGPIGTAASHWRRIVPRRAGDGPGATERRHRDAGANLRARWTGRWLDVRRPLDRVGSIKLKLGIAIVAGVATASFVTYLGFGDTWPPTVRPLLRIAVALVVVQVLTRGMTSPLREMAAAARAMAAGSWGQRVTDTSADEVGELARAFNAMAAELAAVDRMRKDLIANVSHELRTPISALQARLENMVDGVEQPDPALLASMLEQTERLGRLVAQLLDLSRLESGRVPLHREDVEVAALLDAVAAEARLHDPGRRIDVAVAPAGLRLHADHDRIHQVLANLTANALRHGPDARPVTLSAGLAGGHVVLTVADEGPGIPQADAERVFERFYRADAARTGTGTAADGAGLGLSIARWIVDLHGGDIRALPNDPTGCAIVCRLPLTPRSAASPPAATPATPTRPSPAHLRPAHPRPPEPTTTGPGARGGGGGQGVPATARRPTVDGKEMAGGSTSSAGPTDRTPSARSQPDTEGDQLR